MEIRRTMEIAIWVLLSLLVAFALKQLIHILRYKSDRYYRYQTDQAVQYKEFKNSAARLGGMSPRPGNCYLDRLSRSFAGWR
jgi:hypothetical protein